MTVYVTIIINVVLISIVKHDISIIINVVLITLLLLNIVISLNCSHFWDSCHHLIRSYLFHHGNPMFL